MKKLLIPLMLLLLLALPAHADGPTGLAARLDSLSVQELSPLIDAALAQSELSGAALCCRKDGSPAAIAVDYTVFAVATRRDGLMTLCCLEPARESLTLAWHNDLLLSHSQDITLSTTGAAWSGGTLPEMYASGDQLTVALPMWNGSRLHLTCEACADDWRVTEISVHASPDGQRWSALFSLPEDCLSDDILLSRCHPGNWNEPGGSSW